MLIKETLETLIARKSLSKETMQAVLGDCLSGKLTDGQIAAFLVALRMKGETIEELTTAAQVLKQFSKPIDLGASCLDIVGTGGDGKNTFNISTTSAFVAAAAGVKVAKHGNYGVSSTSGSANLLEEAGIRLDCTEQQLKDCIHATNLAFLFAPAFNPAMGYVRSARQQLGIRSFFNLLGPLTNPAQVKRMVVGVFPADLQEPIAQVLSHLGLTRALVLSSTDGLDEVSIAAVTTVIEYNQGQFSTWTIDPKAYGLAHNDLNAILVDTPKKSLALMQSVLSGHPGSARDIVVLNAACAIYCAELAASYEQALVQAQLALDSGKALMTFEQLKKRTQP